MSGYEHVAAPAWTVGHLREALAELPADMAVQVRVPSDPPGPDQAPFGDDFVLTGAGHDSVLWDDEGPTMVDQTLTLQGDWPTGTYETGEEER